MFAVGFSCGSGSGGGGSGGAGGNAAGASGTGGAHGGTGGQHGGSGGSGGAGVGGQAGGGGEAAGGQPGGGAGGLSAGGHPGSGGAAGAAGSAAGAAGSGGAGGAGAAGAAGAAGGHAGGGAGGNAGSGARGVAGGAGSSSSGTGGDVSLGADGGLDAAACQGTSLAFTQRAPTVFILVDQGGQEFDSATTGTFFQIRTAVEAVTSALGAEVRFGFGSYVGSHASGACQLDFSSVPTGANNAAAIKALYDTLGPLQPYGTKADNPAVEALPMVRQALVADTGGGPQYLLLINDGITDFCDDGNAVCPADATTFLIQSLYLGTPSIGTLVVGVPIGGTTTTMDAAVLQNFANAGAGQPSVVAGATADDVYDECEGMTNGGAESWQSLYVSAGKSGVTPLATYASQAGTAPLYLAASTSASDIETQIGAALSSIKSCTFDLQQVHIDLAKLGEASVSINGNAVPLDATNGWQMPSGTKLDLEGTACATWRAGSAQIKFDFPCDSVLSN